MTRNKKETEVKVNYTEDEQEPQKNNTDKEEQNTEETVTGEEKTEEPEEPSREEVLQKKVAELEDKLLRNMAEFENFKKRTARQFDDMVRSSNDRIIVEILEIIDNFERAIQHSDKNGDSDAFRQGIELIYNQMLSLLGKYEIEAIDAIGKAFNPNLHEAMMQLESDEYDDGMVAMEIVKGYKQGDRVIRHSKVGVSKGKPVKPENDADPDK